MSIEKEVKSILKSLTLSSAKGITVSNLCRDYREIVGCSIPFQKMGYSDLIGFLNSIPDTLRMAGSGMSALVIPVTDEKTAHLEEMIQKQRKPTQSRSKSRWRNDSRRVIQRPRAIRIETKNDRCGASSYTEDFKVEQNSFSKPNILPTELIEEKHYNWNDISSDESQSKFNDMMPTTSENYSTPNIQNETKSRVRATNNSNNEFVASTISRKYIDPFKAKLRELISKYPNGIWCSELPQFYKKHFNENLNVPEKGYCSVIHFCTSHSDIFHCIKPSKGDWKIYDAQRPIPNVEDDSCNNYSSTDESFTVGNKDTALPELDLTDILHFSNQNIEVMPSEILQFGEKILRQWLRIPDDGYITVRVTEVYDPSKFWFQLYSEDCSVALDNLMNEMQIFYVLNDIYNIPTSDVQVGLYCVSLIYNEWHRGIVVKIEDPYVKIFYLDYGSIGKSLRNSLKYLHKKFSTLPRQAIRARLANIKPNYPAIMWSQSATKLLLNMVNNRILVAEVLNSVEIQYHTLHLILTDTNDPNKDVHINDELKKQGFAELMTELCKINTHNRNGSIKEKHYFLYPNHKDIERAVVPSIDEVIIMTTNGVSMDMIFKPYINSIERNQKYSFNLKTLPINRKLHQMDFYVSKNNDVIENEEDDSCLEVDEILPETEYDSDERSSCLETDGIFPETECDSDERSIITVGSLQDELPHLKLPTMQSPTQEKPKEIDVSQSKTIFPSTSNMQPPIREELEKIDELTNIEMNNERVEEVINTASKSAESLNITTNIERDCSAINFTIRPPPGFQLPKPVMPPQIDPYAIHTPYYPPYSLFPAPLSPHSAQLMQTMMYYGATAAAAQIYLSSQAQFYQNMYSNQYSVPNFPKATNTAEVVPDFRNVPTSTSSINNIVTKNQSLKNVLNIPFSSNTLNTVTKQTDHLSLSTNDENSKLQNNEKTSVKIQTIVNDLNDDLRTLLQIKENNNTQEISLLEDQINEIIRNIVTENVVTSLADNLIKLIKSQISKVLLEKQQNTFNLGVNQQNRGQFGNTSEQMVKNNEAGIREKLTDVSKQVDINYEINKLNNETIETVPIEPTNYNCDVEKIKNIECEKLFNVSKYVSKDKSILKDNIVGDTTCNEKAKTCSEKVIEGLNISKQKSISKDNLCTKIEPKCVVELREFAQKKIHVIKVNGECYFSTLEFMLTYTKFPNVDRVKSIFLDLKIDFPSIEFNMEIHAKHSYKKLIKHKVPGCSPQNPFINLIKFQDVPIMLEKLFATNPALVKDLQNYTNEIMCK